MSRKGPGPDESRDDGDPFPPHPAGRSGKGAATPWAWRSSLSRGVDFHLPEAFFLGDAAQVARDLLGTCFRSTVEGAEVRGVVVETEAYVGPHDPASHAAERIGRTLRNHSMHGPPGRAYVYRIYGVHWCLNVVTGEEGYPAAVLIRGLDPVAGEDVMRARRRGREPSCAGPGRLCEALGVTGTLDGHPLDSPPLELLRGWVVSREHIAVSGRVGIRRAAEWPLRFYLRGHPQVSRGPREMVPPIPTSSQGFTGTETPTEPEDE